MTGQSLRTSISSSIKWTNATIHAIRILQGLNEVIHIIYSTQHLVPGKVLKMNKRYFILIKLLFRYDCIDPRAVVRNKVEKSCRPLLSSPNENIRKTMTWSYSQDINIDIVKIQNNSIPPGSPLCEYFHYFPNENTHILGYIGNGWPVG